MDGLVSVIMPTYNCGSFIAESIESVIAQTYTNWELVITDDCSADNTAEVVSAYMAKDDRIKYFRLEKNAGPAGARNRSIEEAKGDYIAFLDSDDLWTPDKLEKQLAFMNANGINFCCTAYGRIDEAGAPLEKVSHPLRRADYNTVLYRSNPCGNSTVIFNAAAIGKFFVPDIRKRNDFALWLQVLKKEKYVYGFDEILCKYRIRSGSVSSNKLSLLKYHWFLYRKIEKLSIPKSIFALICWVFVKLFQK